MDAFFSFIKQITPLSEESIAAMGAVLQLHELPKGHVLLRPGAICHHFYFVEQGLTRTWYIKEGKDITDWLSAENSIAVSIVSFLTGQPDVRGIELLEPSVIWAVPRNELERLYAQYHDIERLGRLLLTMGVIQMQQRFDDLHFSNALQRYRKLIDTHPTFVNRVPLGMIASYLGITQETLSRIRSQL